MEKHKQPTNPQSDSSFNTESKPVKLVKPTEGEPAENDHCPLKPKMLKFKKEKDGKLSFARSKSYTKLHSKESYCKSPLKFVGNDPESESQTLQSYLDDDCEPVVGKAVKKDDCSEKVDCSGDDSNRQKDRGFLASLQEADIECVAVVCKRTSSITAQSKSQIASEDSALEASQQQESGEIDDQKLEVKQKPSEEGTTSAVNSDLHDNACDPDSVISDASSFPDPNYKLQSEHELAMISPGKSCCVRQSECVTITYSCNQLSSNKTGESLSKDDCVMNQNENLFVLDTPSTPQKTSDSSCTISREKELTQVDDSNFTDEPLDGMPGSSTVNNSTDPSQIKSLQHFNENTSHSIDEGSREASKADKASDFIDEDSSDDFQVSSIKQSQSSQSFAPKQDKSKKRKSRKKVNNRTASRGVRRNHKNNKEPPSWSCSACTFINDGQLLECSMCLTPHATTEDSAQITKNIDSGNLVKKSHDVELVESTGFPDSTSIDSVGTNTGLQNRMSLGEPSGSSQGTDRNGSERTEELPESSAERDLSSLSKERPADKDNCTFLGDEGAVDDSGLPSWSCSACTFFNMSQMIECSLCLTPRRRSKRQSTSKYAHEVQGRGSGTENKNNASRKRRRKSDVVKKDEILEMDTSSNCLLTSVDENNHDDRIMHCDPDAMLADKVTESVVSSHANPDALLTPNSDQGLTPEPMESSHTDPESAQKNTNIEDLTIENSHVIKSRPRKRLRLDNCKDINTSKDETDISNFSDDSDTLCNSSPSTCASSLSASALLMTVEPSDGKGIAESEDCVGSNDVNKMGKCYSKPHIEPENHERNDRNENCDLLNLSDHSLDMTDISEACSAKPSCEIAVAEAEPISCVREQTDHKEVENLDKLKAVAEEVFMCEWEDGDDYWWEEDSNSGQSSCPSSSDTASSSQSSTKINTGFTKCSDLYSVAELKNKLQSTPEQTMVNTTTAVDNTQRFELVPDHKMPAPPAHQESGTPVEEEEIDEPESLPEPMKLKFCLSLYTERVYLYDEVNI